MSAFILRTRFYPRMGFYCPRTWVPAGVDVARKHVDTRHAATGPRGRAVMGGADFLGFRV
jgi:hypothetical protein